MRVLAYVWVALTFVMFVEQTYQMKETTWYFKPDIGYVILLSMACWKLAGADGMRYHKKIKKRE